jgi:Family of unknown function (DUF6163)
MTDETQIARRPLFLPSLLMTIFMRLVALGCLWFALNIWAELVGLSANGNLRFDLLSSDMKAATATLAVLYPVAAIGLWLKGSWGPVIWTLAAAVEIFMHQGFPEVYGADLTRMLLIALTALTYIGLRVALWTSKPPFSTTSRGFE